MTELTTAEVLARLAELGRPIAESTWRGAVAREVAPQPVRHVGRTPLWDSDEVGAYGRGEWTPPPPTVWAVVVAGGYEPPEVYALYDNQDAAMLHAASQSGTGVTPFALASKWTKGER